MLQEIIISDVRYMIEGAEYCGPNHQYVFINKADKKNALLINPKKQSEESHFSGIESSK